MVASTSYASATGNTSLRNTTSSVLTAHVPLLIVQRNVTVLPAVKPLTVLVVLDGVVIVTPGSAPNTLQTPVPTEGLLPAKVKKVVLLH